MTSHPVATTAYALAYVTIIVSGVVAVNVGAKVSLHPDSAFERD
jgi:hypothetical protein